MADRANSFEHHEIACQQTWKKDVGTIANGLMILFASNTWSSDENKEEMQKEIYLLPQCLPFMLRNSHQPNSFIVAAPS